MRKRILVALATVFVVLSGCSLFMPPVQYYSFTYEFRGNHQHVAILEYRLWAGDTTISCFSPSTNQSESYTESISPRNIGPRPEFLRVKWIDKSTGEIYEDTADLRPRMPNRLESNVIYLTLTGNLLQVYLAELRGKATNPLSELSPYSNLPAIRLYSESPEKTHGPERP